jgi:uncharacterized damage-inducible protein DinB
MIKTGPINRDGLLALYAYNAYANHLVLETAAGLDEEALARQSSPSHGSVRNLLLHMLRAEAGFLTRCQERLFDPPSVVSLQDIRSYWDDLARAGQDFIASLDEVKLSRELDVELRGHLFRFPVWQLLVQAFVHSTHHRGELSILLTELGRPLPTLDIIIHFARESGQAWPWE